MLAGFSRKTDYDTKIFYIEKIVTDHDHDKYITTSEFIDLTIKKFSCKISTSKFSNKHRV